MKYIYLLESHNNEHKIGVTNNIDKRIKSLNTGTANNLILLKSFNSEYPFKVEKMIHKTFNKKKINREWFKLSIDDINKFEPLCFEFENRFKILSESDNPFFN